MRASTPRGRRGRRTKPGALAILDETLLDALRALLAQHPALEDPGNITDGDSLPIMTVAGRVADRIMELRELLGRYESAVRDPPRASPTDDDIF